MRWQLLNSRLAGQATLELALSLPLLLVVLLLIVDIGRVVQAELGVQATAREAARTCATAPTEAACLAEGVERARQVAAGYGLDVQRTEVTLDDGRFARTGTAVARASYRLGLLGSGRGFGPSLEAEATHAEPIDRYRSRIGVTR